MKKGPENGIVVDDADGQVQAARVICEAHASPAAHPAKRFLRIMRHLPALFA